MADCSTCTYYIKDYSTGAADCQRYDDMTEDETDRFWSDGEDGCPYYEEEGYDWLAEDEAEDMI